MQNLPEKNKKDKQITDLLNEKVIIKWYKIKVEELPTMDAKTLEIIMDLVK